MNRSQLTFSGLIAFFCTSVLFSSYANAGERESSADRSKPNDIIFFLDDSGYGDFAHNGNPTIRTPNISKLAQAMMTKLTTFENQSEQEGSFWDAKP